MHVRPASVGVACIWRASVRVLRKAETVMTPAGVLAMRDLLAEGMIGRLGVNDREAYDTAEWLIESGWVAEEPKEKNDEV